MSIQSGLSGTPVGPPWSVDDIADVHAGLYPPEVTAVLRAQIAADPDGAAVLAALDSTVDELSLLPPLVMPQQYALRLDQAIAAEALARAEGRAAPVVKGGFGALLSATSAGAPPPGLPTLTAPPSVVPQQRTSATGPVPAMPTAGPPQRHEPLIPRVLPGADRHQPRRNPPGPARPLHSAPPYAPTSVAGPSGQAPDVARPAGPGRGPGRADGPGGSGPAAGRPANVTSLDAHRAKRRRWVGGLLAAAAVAAVATFGVIGLRNANNGPDTADQGQPAATVSTTTTVPPGGATNSGGLQAFTIEKGKFAEAFDKLNGVKEGRLTNPIVFASCAAANNITGTDVIGVSDVTYQGAPAMAIAVALPDDPTKARVLVVGTDCGPGGAQLLAEETVAR